MTTIADNIRSMAALVSEVKRTHHLTENTVLRIVDMNFALAHQENAPDLGGLEDGVFEPTLVDGEFTFTDEPEPEGDEEVLATTDHPPTPLEN